MFRKIAVLTIVMAAMLWIACSKDKSTSLKSGAIEGRVTADGVGVPGVYVYATPYVYTEGEGKTDNIADEASVASDGDYRLELLPGTYRIYFDVELLGEDLFTSRYPIEVASDGHVTVNVDLKDPTPTCLLARVGDACVNLTFESGYRDLSFRVFRSPADRNEYTLIGTIENSYNTVSYIDEPPDLQRYKYKVTGITNNGETEPTNVAEVNFTGAISAPTDLRVEDHISWISLYWGDRSNATQYNIYRSTSQNDWSRISTTNSLVFVDTPAVHGIYNYRLTALSRYGTESPPSLSISINYDGRLDPPEQLTITDRGSSLSLTWESNTQSVYYNIYRSTASDGIYSKIDSVFTQSYSDRPAIISGQYYYKVTVVGPNLLESDYSNFVNSYFDGVLDPPQSIYIEDEGLLIYLDWDAISWAEAYIIYRSDDNGTTYSQIARISSNNSDYEDSPPSAGTYYYKVAVESDGGAVGPLSAPVNFYFSANLHAPASVFVQSMGVYVTVGWNYVNGATAYSIYRATDISGDYAQIEDSTTSTSFSDTPPVAGSYYYRVQAFDNHGHRSSMSVYGYVYFPARPLPPTNVHITDYNYYILVGWISPGSCDSSQVYRATTYDGPYVPQGWTRNLLYEDYPSSAGHFYYKVEAIYRGVTSEMSGYAHIYFSGRLESPTNLIGYDSGTSVRLGWHSNIGNLSYDVYRGTSPDSLVLNQTVYNSSATDTPPAAGSYYYAVLARTRGGLTSPMCPPILVEFTP